MEKDKLQQAIESDKDFVFTYGDYMLFGADMKGTKPLYSLTEYNSDFTQGRGFSIHYFYSYEGMKLALGTDYLMMVDKYREKVKL